MLTLLLDTSCQTAHITVSDDAKVLGGISLSDMRMHSVKLLPGIDELLSKLNIKISDIEAVAVTNGPGSYTGLRVAAVTAKTIAYAQKIPLISVNTLDAVAMSHKASDTVICPIIDARNTRVYGGVFENGTVLKGDYFIGDVSDFAKSIEIKDCVRYILCGDGVLNDEIVSDFRKNFDSSFEISDAPLLSYEGLACMADIVYINTPDKASLNPDSLVLNYMKEWL